MKSSDKKNGTITETIIQVTKSTPVLNLLFFRNMMSSTNDYKTKNEEKYSD